MIPKQIIDANQQIPDVLRGNPQAREVFDRYGLRGCGGPLGPAETIGYFARAHGVDLDRLLSELNSAGASVPNARAIQVPTLASQAQPEDAIYRPFVLVALASVMIVGAGFGSWMLLNIANGQSFWASSFFDLNGHAHAQIFGWIGLFVMGFAYQAFPRFGHTTLRWPALAWSSLALMLAGIVLTELSQFAHASPAALGLALAGGVCEVAATSIFATVVVGTRARSLQPRQPWEVWVTLGLAWFVLSAVAEMCHLAWLLAASDGASQIDRVATWQAPLRVIQLQGFALAFVLGVSQRMLPAIFGWTPVTPRRCRTALALVTVGVLVQAVFFPLYRFTTIRPWLYGSWGGSVLVALGALSVASAFRLHRAPEFRDRGAKFVRSAYLWLCVALILEVLAPFYNSSIRVGGFSHAWLDASRHAFTLGFLSFMILGVSSKVVATLNGIPAARLPELWTSFFLLNAAIALRVVGAIASDWIPAGFPIAAVSGPLAAAGLGLYGFHVVGLMRAGAVATAEATGVQHAPTVPKVSPSCDCCSSAPDASNPLHYSEADGEEVMTCGTACAPLSRVLPQDITEQTKVGWLVDEDPRTLSVFFQHGFHMLSNPVLRRTIARQTSIAQAVRLHGGSLELLLSDLRAAVAEKAESQGELHTCGGSCPST